MNLDKDAGFGTEDLDEEVLFAWECFWHIMCEFGSVMELKKIINLADDRTTLHVLQELRRIAPDKNITDEQALDDEYWKNEAESIACFLTDEEMEGIRAIDLEPYVEKVCDEDYEDKQECTIKVCGRTRSKYKRQIITGKCREVYKKHIFHQKLEKHTRLINSQMGIPKNFLS
ncbi:hypothetical protein CDAR_456181 [Caerostris darwini]|uniref:Uncharacterized protein n=1 Tax=Caerostris darwini TaxID=1538125 RepID=A0AAV4RPT2_9ARAC|nr:hypothetical protein CDAR_456181 [Caerostris darwini]